MANTTKSEQTPAEKAQEQVVVSKSVTKTQVEDLYQQGYSVMAIANEVYGFDSDEAMNKIRQILGVE